MLNSLYKLPKSLLAVLFIGGGIAFMILNDPPHTFCDSQIEQFKKIQRGILYRNPKDFHKEKSILNRTKNTCWTEGAPGACYEYFAYLKRLLKDFHVLSPDCVHLIYSTPAVQQALSSALTLMTALAWREEVLAGQVSKFNWLTRADLSLFCEVKNKYIVQYGQENYQLLENQIINQLPLQRKVSGQLIKKRSILSEPCAIYR